MKFNIHGSRVEVTDSIKNYIEGKLKKLDKYFENPDSITATVMIRIRGNDQIIEVTVPSDKFTLRGEESHKDLYAAIDLVTDKIERQIRKNKTRIKKNYKEVIDFSSDINIEEEDKSSNVKRKLVDMKPMNEEEAILQMNLLGHDFFVFKDTDTDNVSVIYKRKDGDYGIITTK